MAEDFLGAGIDAFRQHHLESAQAKFAKAVISNPDSEDAWLWLARVIADRERQLYCYLRVLDINPRNAEAVTAFQYVASSARPPSVQRALAMINPQPVRRISPMPIVAPRQMAQSVHPVAPPKRASLMPGYLVLNLFLIFVFLSLYIVVAWNNITTQVQNVAITPATIITRALVPSATAPGRSSQTPTRNPSPRLQTNSGRPSDALFAEAQKELDAKNSQKVLDILLPNLSKLTDKNDLANAYYYLGRAELDLEDYRTAAGYLKKLYALDPSVENSFMLAVSYDLAGDAPAALEQYMVLAAWNGKDAAIYHGLAEKRMADIKQSFNSSTAAPTIAK